MLLKVKNQCVTDPSNRTNPYKYTKSVSREKKKAFKDCWSWAVGAREAKKQNGTSQKLRTPGRGAVRAQILSNQ